MLHGADADALDALGAQLADGADRLDAIGVGLRSALMASPWDGADAEGFRLDWDGPHVARLTAASTAMRSASTVLGLHATEQRIASGVAGPGGAGRLVGPGLPGPGGGFGWGDNYETGREIWAPIGRTLKWKTAVSFLQSWKKSDLAASAFKAPQFLEAGGSFGRLQKGVGKAGYGAVGAGGARAFGAVTSGLATASDLARLVEQGNPVDAFRADPASYSSDVASMLFNGSTTAFFVAPNPYTAGAVAVTGIIYAGTEVWDNWPEISGAVSDGADWAGDRLDDAGKWAGDRLDDAPKWAEDRLGDAYDNFTFWN
ncbi:MAG: WXG100 family type VII secretion target [Iamia sp.]